MPARSLREWIDHEAIVDVTSRYARGVDRRDAALYRSCFTDTIELDMAGLVRHDLPADEWVEQAFSLVARYDATQHFITNHAIALEGDAASCRAEVQAQHWTPDGAWLMGGHYRDRLVRTADGWRIATLTLTIAWSETTGGGARPGGPPGRAPGG